MKRIGFIGVGTMGMPMAANLVRKGFAVTLYDAAPGRAVQVADELGCQSTTSLGGLAASDFVVTMLPDGKVVQDVLVREGNGALPDAVRPGTVFIDMSSSEPLLPRQTGALLAQRGLTLVGAPVSGARTRAEAGTLAIMIGCGSTELVAKVTPVL